MNKTQIVKGVDPRAYSTERLKAPYPLPFISRRSLRRVRDRLEPPTSCNICHSTAVRIVSNAEIYGREYGHWPYAYMCDSCGSYVGLHPNTDLPLGHLADAATREARKAAKELFFRMLHRHCRGDRTQAYRKLAELLGIDQKRCHFGQFDLEQSLAARRVLEEFLSKEPAPTL